MKKIQIKRDNQIFSRFEFKYIIKKNISESIKNEVKNFTKIDAHIENKDKYLVRSLYFDNDFIFPIFCAMRVPSNFFIFFG